MDIIVCKLEFNKFDLMKELLFIKILIKKRKLLDIKWLLEGYL